jgi:hypothetical protein
MTEEIVKASDSILYVSEDSDDWAPLSNKEKERHWMLLIFRIKTQNLTDNKLMYTSVIYPENSGIDDIDYQSVDAILNDGWEPIGANRDAAYVESFTFRKPLEWSVGIPRR